MTLILLCQFTAQHVSGVNTPIFSRLRLLCVLLHRLYCAVMIEVYVLIYLSSGKCYTYIMCRECLWVSVFLQACGVLWLLSFLVCGMFWWCFIHMYCCLYVWACTYPAWGVLMLCSGLAAGDVVSECRLNHYWPVLCGPWRFRSLWPFGTMDLYRLDSAREWFFYCGGGIGYGIVHMAKVSFGYLYVWVES